MGYFMDSYFLHFERFASDEFPTIVGTDHQIRTDWHLVGQMEVVQDETIPFAFHFLDMEEEDDEEGALPCVSILPGDLDFMDEDERGAEINEEELHGALLELLDIRIYRGVLRCMYKNGGSFCTGRTSEEVVERAIEKIKEKLEETDGSFAWEYDLKLKQDIID